MSNNKIPNKTKYIGKIIDLFYDKSIIVNKPDDWNKPNFRPAEFYSHGHCAEFAYTLATYLKSKDIETEITIMFRERYTEDTNDLIERIFSHCVVELEDKSFDITSPEGDARIGWFIKTNYIAQSESGASIKWDFVKIPVSNEKHAFSELESHCEKHSIHLDKNQIEKDMSIFESLLNKKRDIELTP